MTDPEDLIATGRAHLARIEAAGDPSLTLDPQVAAVTGRLHEYIITPDGTTDLDARYVHGWLGWHRYQADPSSDEGILGHIAALMDLLYCYVVGLAPLPEPLLASFADRARWAEDELRERAEKLSELARATGDRRRIAAAIRLWRQMIGPANPVHPEDVPMSWSNLGILLAARYELDGVRADLDEAIDAYRKALNLETPDSRQRATYEANLSAALYQRAMITGSGQDGAEALALGRRRSELGAPGDVDQARYLSNAGVNLLRSFEVSSVEDDLSAAIIAFEQALSAYGPGDQDRGGVLSNLGHALLRRYELTGSDTDLDTAVRSHRDALRATPAADPSRGKRMFNLSTALRASFKRSNKDPDLAEAIETATRALELIGASSPDRPGALYVLGSALGDRFYRGGALNDLDDGIRLLREAVEKTPPSHADRAVFAGNLGSFLIIRHDWTGAVADLDAAIELVESAADAAPADAIFRPALLSFLGSALAIRATLPEPPPGRSDADLLDQAVAAGEKALAATPLGHLERPRYAGALAISLHTRALLTGSAADLDEAVAKAEEAVEADQPSVAGDLPTAGPDAERAARLSALATFLRERAHRTESAADLDRALTISYLAVNTVPRDHPSRAPLLMSVARCMQDEFDRHGKRRALILARNMYLLAADTESATPTVRVNALREAAALTTIRLSWATFSERKRIRETAALLERAVRLLPEVAPRQLARTDQQRQIGGFAGLASDAAAYALADERLGQTRAQRAAHALSLLELGRGIMLSQALDTRSDLTDLRRLRPDLAQRWERLRDLLDPPTADGPTVLPPDGNAATALAPGSDRSQLARAFAATVTEIRQVDGLANFMSPPPPENLAEAAGSGTVVFNVSALRSDAILIKSSGYLNKDSGGPIDYVQLPQLTLDALTEKIELYRAAQEQRMSGAAPEAERTLLEILDWLWDVAARPALDGLHFDGRPNPWGLYEVKWVAGGLLGLLPLHAAGRHRAAVNDDGSPVSSPDGRQPPTVMDRVISSYAPTVRALSAAYDRERPTRWDPPERSLIVAMPVTADEEALAAAVRQLRDVLPGAVALLKPAAVEVRHRLDDCEIAHFMCHGVTDPVDPSRSHLVFGAGPLADPLTVGDLAHVRLGSARLAYLSACSTARNEVVELADESIHLAAAFQLAGFPHVVGTLWEVDAVVAERVADEFYRRISADGGFPDVRRSATVLHEIIRDLRSEEPRSPFAWAAHLHVGT